MMNQEKTMSKDDVKSKVVKTDAEWKAQLTPEQYAVARKHGTEPAFTGPNWDQKKPGMYLLRLLR